MTMVHGIKLGWRLAAISLFTGCFSLATTVAMALVSGQRSASQPSDVQQTLVASASSFQASRAFPSAADAPQQLAIRTAKPNNQSHKLWVHNLCTKSVEMVIRYQDPQQNWVTQGGFHISGQNSRYLTSSSSQILGLSNKQLYYYATSPDSDLVWSGNGSHRYLFGEQTLNMRIHYAAIDALGNYSLFILCASDSP